MTEDAYHHGDLPSALLRAVGELIEEGGVAAVSVRAVARRAGVSHAAPAHHFGDRGGLLAAYAAQGFDAFHERFGAALAELPPDATVADAARAMGETYIRFGVEERGWYQVMFRPEMVDCEADVLVASGGRAFGALIALHRACLAPEATDEDVLTLSVGAWAIVHGFVSLHNDMPTEQQHKPDMLPLAAGVLDLLRAGARAHPLWVGDEVPADRIPEDLGDPLVPAA